MVSNEPTTCLIGKDRLNYFNRLDDALKGLGDNLDSRDVSASKPYEQRVLRNLEEQVSTIRSTYFCIEYIPFMLGHMHSQNTIRSNESGLPWFYYLIDLSDIRSKSVKTTRESSEIRRKVTSLPPISWAPGDFQSVIPQRVGKYNGHDLWNLTDLRYSSVEQMFISCSIELYLDSTKVSIDEAAPEFLKKMAVFEAKVSPNKILGEFAIEGITPYYCSKSRFGPFDTSYVPMDICQGIPEVRRDAAFLRFTRDSSLYGRELPKESIILASGEVAESSLISLGLKPGESLILF